MTPNLQTVAAGFACFLAGGILIPPMVEAWNWYYGLWWS